MAQERSIPGCPWAFADDMRGIIDKKEFRFVLQTTVVFKRAVCELDNAHSNRVLPFNFAMFFRYKASIRRTRGKSKKTSRFQSHWMGYWE